jgi:hypothetical protein
VHSGQPSALVRSNNEIGIWHVKRANHVLAQIVTEILLAHGFDRFADIIHADAVLPALAGIERQRRVERLALAGGDAGKVGIFHIFGGVGIPDVVSEAAGMGQQVAQRYVALGRPQFRFSVAAKSLEDLRRRYVGKIGKHLLDWLIKPELALLHKLHGHNGSHRLGQRRDPQYRVQA